MGDFPIGTRVRLKSGKRVMLVVDFDLIPALRIRCAWEGGEKSFPAACLVLVP